MSDFYNSNHSFDNIRELVIGTIESISPNNIKVQLELNAPKNTAINQGFPTSFPRINEYVLIPQEIGFLVGQINWLGIEYSDYPKREGFKDYDIVNLPFPLRKMNLIPIGLLKKKNGKQQYKIERGVYSYPSVGDSVILPSEQQLRSIIENRDEKAKIKIGTAPIAGEADVKVDPDKLFGRHIAVLGNTGSGKSCSVAGLIRWSLETAKTNSKKQNGNLNSRFIILDPNGEYKDCFSDFEETNVKKFSIEKQEDKSDFEQLKIPGWLWNSQEWISFSRAQPGTQRPLLLDALNRLKNGRTYYLDINTRFVNFLKGFRSFFKDKLTVPPSNFQYKDKFEIRDRCNEFLKDIQEYKKECNNHNIDELENNLKDFYLSNSNPNDDGSRFFLGCSETDLKKLIQEFSKLIDNYQDSSINASEITSDSPIPFDINELNGTLSDLASARGNQLSQFADYLNYRIESILRDERLKEAIKTDENYDLLDWISDFLHDSQNYSQITVIDLSLVPQNIIHLVISIISRVIFESIQRYKKYYKKELPTSLILEEAHYFIGTYPNLDQNTPANLCNHTFERIAREGRKFGLGLMLSSQRPSEISQTVLSQCNTFLLHRLVNDEDQKYISRLVPDNLKGLFDELPSLPTKQAILLGWASPIPVLVEMNQLPKTYQPQSNDPDFWNVWTYQEGYERRIDWKPIVKEWQGRNDIEEDEDNTIKERKPYNNNSEQNNNIENNNKEESEEDDLPF